MKVRITYDLTEDEMIAINVAQTGQFSACSRETAITWLTDNTGSELVEITSVVRLKRNEIADLISEQMGVGVPTLPS